MSESKTVNNIGLLRIVFAACVIVGHAPELIDGNRSREPLTLLLGSVSLGELAVDSFFLLSGFLLAKSFLQSAGFCDYMTRRLARIYPGFVAAYLASVLLLGPLVGAHPFAEAPVGLVRMAGLLTPPRYPGQLSHLPYPDLNGSLWTIAHEFRCYIFLGWLGTLGLLDRRRSIFALALLLLAAYGAANLEAASLLRDALSSGTLLGAVLQDPVATLRLTGAFLIGACGYLYKDQLLPALSGRAALAYTCLAVAALATRSAFGEPVAVVLGGLGLMWLALKAPLGRLRNINNSYDISYGTYLYGWPIATAWLAFGVTSNPFALILLTLPLALGCGLASWHLIERPILERVRRSRAEKGWMAAATTRPEGVTAA